MPLTVVTPYEITIPEGVIRDARMAAGRKLDASVAALASAHGVEAKPHLTEVPAAPAIAELAKEIGADLVVIGTRGHTGLKHVLLGSVAEKIVRDGTGDGANGARIAFGKINDRPLELAGAVDR